MVATVHVQGVAAAGGRGGRDLAVVEVTAVLEPDEGGLTGAIGIGGAGQGAVFPDGVAVGVKTRDPLHVAAVGAGGVVALLGKIVPIATVDDVLLVVLVDRHQGALLAGHPCHDGAALLVAALFARGANAALEVQPFVALFEHHVDHATNGVGTVDGGAAVQVDLDPLNGGHGDGVEVDGGAAHGGGTRYPLAVQQNQGTLGTQAAQADGGLGLEGAAGGRGDAAKGVVGGLLEVIGDGLLTGLLDFRLGHGDDRGGAFHIDPGDPGAGDLDFLQFFYVLALFGQDRGGHNCRARQGKRYGSRESAFPKHR